MNLHDHPAEIALLGLVTRVSMRSPADALDLLDGLDLAPEDFARPGLPVVAKAMRAILARGHAIGSLGLADEILGMGCTVRMGELLDSVENDQALSRAEAPALADRVRDLARRRRMAAVAERLQAAAHNATEAPKDSALSISAELVELGTSGDQPDATLQDALLEYLDRMDEIRAGRRLATVPTGIEIWDELLGGLQAGVVTFIGAQPSVGKALALDTPIATPSGWTTMGDLRKGAEVFDEHGRPTRVVAATEAMLGRPCFEVEFSDGSCIVADGSHQWATVQAQRRQTKDRGTVSIVTTEEMARTLRTTCDGRMNHYVAVAGALHRPARTLPMDPYVLGIWLGDGIASCAAYSKPDDEIAEHVKACGYEVWRRPSEPDVWTISRDPSGRKTVAVLREMGLLGNKHVPREYLDGSEQQRLALLQGLMDTDGTCSTSGVCSFSSATEQIADAVEELVVSLGMKATRYTRIPSVSGRPELVCQREFRVIFNPARDVFRLRRKLKRIRPAARHRGYRTVIAVRAVESVPVRCIQVESESHLFLAGRACIPTHNSALIGSMARNIAKAGHTVGVFSLEDSRDWLVERTLSWESGVPVRRLVTADVRPHEEADFASGGERVHGWASRMIIDDRSRLTAQQVAAKARHWVVARGARAIIVDHLGELDLGNGHDRHDLAVTAAVAHLRDVAKDLNVPVVVCAHFARPPRSNDEPRYQRPTSSSWANSAGVERMARVAVGLWLPKPEEGAAPNDEIICTVLKQTRGDKDFDFTMLLDRPSGLVRTVGGRREDGTSGHHEHKRGES